MATDEGATPLCVAAHRRRLEVVRFLVANKAGVDKVRDTDGCTHLYIAAQNGHLEVVR